MMNRIAISCLLLLCLLIVSVQARNLPSSTYSGSDSRGKGKGKGLTKAPKSYKLSKKTMPNSTTRGSRLSNGSNKGNSKGSDPDITQPTGNTKKSAGGGFPTVAPTPFDACVGQVNGITLDFDDLDEDESLIEYECLVWTNFRASETSPAPPSLPRALVPSLATTSVESTNGSTFSLVSIDIAGARANAPVQITGFDANGVLTVSKSIDYTTSYQEYDVSEFTNVQRVVFDWGTANASGTDNWVFA
eukprot:scaffold6992_cov102-Cylindrotheca_fusiformis.AAC.3